MNRCFSVVIVFTLLLSVVVSFAQPSLRLIQPHDPQNGMFNPDSVMVDANCPKGTIWFKGKYLVNIRHEIFLPGSLPDSFGFYAVSALDSTAPSFAVLNALSTQLGSMSIRRDFIYPSDTTLDRHWLYALHFSEYVSKHVCDSILATCSMIYRHGLERSPTSLQGNTRAKSMMRDLRLEEVTTPEELHIKPKPLFHRAYRGFGGYLREIRIPLAWEITKGNRDVFVGIDDNFLQDTLRIDTAKSGPDSGQIIINRYTYYEHPDLHVRNSSGVGNLIRPPQYLSTYKTAFPTYDYIGADTLGGTYGMHGITCAVIANGEDNSNGTTPDDGLIGVAPAATSFATFQPSNYGYLDMKPDAGIQYPHVINRSYINLTDNLDGFSLKKGIVSVTALENVLGVLNTDLDTNATQLKPYTTEVYEGVPKLVAEFNYSFPVARPPAGTVYADSSDPTNSHMDVRVLTVKGYDNTIAFPFEDSEDCVESGIDFVGMEGRRNFSTGLEKYPMDEDVSIRTTKKFNASVDVVCPYPMVLSTAWLKSPNYVIIDTLHYAVTHESGNSFCAPQVTGIIGLMMSVQDRLGKTGYDVQRKAYNIVTFTADKIHDPGVEHHVDTIMKKENRERFSKAQTDSGEFVRTYDIIPNLYTKLRTPELLLNGYLNTDYHEQPNDPLKRYWALRVGYGRVNAFRCVAHAIPNIIGANPSNVQYQYNSEDYLAWGYASTVEGRKLLHLGKYKSAGVYVLDSGGIVPDGELPTRNNNGKTIVNAALTVGTNNTLAIDGILATTNVNGGSITTSGNGKILATGWVDKVSLSGEVCWSDLRVTRPTVGNAIVASGNSIGRDTLWLKGKSKLLVTNGSLTLEETAVIILQDSAKIEVSPTGKLVLESGAKIIENRTPLAEAIRLLPSVDTTNRATLACAKNARRATVNAEVFVGKNGRINLDGRAPYPLPSLRVKRITLDTGAVITVDQVGAIAGIDTNSVLFMKYASKIDIQSGDSCYVEMKVQLNSNAEIHARGFCAVGSLKAGNNSLIKVYPGGVLGLLHKDNLVHGKFIAIGDSTAVATVKAISDTGRCRIPVRQMVMANLTLHPQEWITTYVGTNKDSIVSKLTGYLSAEKALFYNVCTKAQNFPIIRVGATPAVTGLLQNVEFRLNRKEYNGAIDDVLLNDSANVLFYAGWDERLHTQQRNSFGNHGGASNVLRGLTRELAVTSCKFHDVGGKISVDNPREASSAENYVITGLMVNSMRKCKVDNNLFAFVYNGVMTNETDYSILNNKVAGCVNGFHHIGRGGEICSNRVGGASQGIDIINSQVTVSNNALGAVMNNAYNSLVPFGISYIYSGYGFRQSGTSNSTLMNNTFQNYAAGVNAQGGTVVAQDRVQSAKNLPHVRGTILEYGRNKFNGTPATIVTESNPYYEAPVNTDVLLNSKARVDIECGLNDFSVPTGQLFHLQAKDGNVNQVVSTNDFNLTVNTLANIRVQNVTPTGTVLDLAETHTNPPCAGVVALADPEVNCINIPDRDPEANWQWDHTYPALVDVRVLKMPKPDVDTSSGVYIQEYYDASKYWSLANGLDIHSRSEYMINAAETVPNIPTAISEGTYLIGQYSAIASDTLEPIVLRQAAAIATSKIFTSREQWGIAADYLESHLGSVFTEKDSVQTLFRIADMRNNADTTISTPERIVQAIHIAHRSTELSNTGGGFRKESKGSLKPVKETGSEPESNYSAFYTQRTGEITVQVVTGYNEPRAIELYSLQGAQVGTYTLRANTAQNTHTCVPVGLPVGVYIVRILDVSDSNKYHGMLLQIY